MNIKHGMYGTPTYKSWRAMRRRIKGRDAHHKKYYADVGITCCDEWSEFSAFFRDMGERPAGTTLDRIDGAAGYNKDNCRWSTKQEQMRNKRDNVNITHDGRTQCLSAWSIEVGLDRRTLRKRMKLGWGARDVLNPRKNFRYVKKEAA